jgi:hypothetical protein
MYFQLPVVAQSGVEFFDYSRRLPASRQPTSRGRFAFIGFLQSGDIELDHLHHRTARCGSDIPVDDFFTPHGQARPYCMHTSLQGSI